MRWFAKPTSNFAKVRFPSCLLITLKRVVASYLSCMLNFGGGLVAE